MCKSQITATTAQGKSSIPTTDVHFTNIKLLYMYMYMYILTYQEGLHT